MFFVWGTKWETEVLEEGTFKCPECEAICSYEHREACKWLGTLPAHQA